MQDGRRIERVADGEPGVEGPAATPPDLMPDDADALERARSGLDAGLDGAAADAVMRMIATTGPVLDDAARAVGGVVDALAEAGHRDSPDAERALGRHDDPYRDLIG